MKAEPKLFLPKYAKNDYSGSIKFYLEALQTLDGHTQRWAGRGHLLGRLSSDEQDQDSITSCNGLSGSPYSFSSIRNSNETFCIKSEQESDNYYIATYHR